MEEVQAAVAGVIVKAVVDYGASRGTYISFQTYERCRPLVKLLGLTIPEMDTCQVLQTGIALWVQLPIEVHGNMSKLDVQVCDIDNEAIFTLATLRELQIDEVSLFLNLPEHTIRPPSLMSMAIGEVFRNWACRVLVDGLSSYTCDQLFLGRYFGQERMVRDSPYAPCVMEKMSRRLCRTRIRVNYRHINCSLGLK